MRACVCACVRVRACIVCVWGEGLSVNSDVVLISHEKGNLCHNYSITYRYANYHLQHQH